MNVEVLGDDIYYGASLNTIFAKQRQRAVAFARMKNRGRGFGDDDIMMDGWLDSVGKFAATAGKSIVKLVKPPAGKIVGAAALTGVAGRLSQTQKAQIASVQEAAGMAPQVLTGGGSTSIAQPIGDTLSKNLPLILGGVAVLGLFAVIALKK